jgi:DNA replication protein DnaC
MSQAIITALKAMKLHGMAANYPEVAAQARHTEFSPEAFLGQLLRAEQAERTVRSMAYQMGAARFPAHRDLAGFEFGQAGVDEALVRTLHGGQFIDAAHNVVLIGGPGTGKTHLATAIGIEAIQRTANGCGSSRPWSWSTRWSWRRARARPGSWLTGWFTWTW